MTGYIIEFKKKETVMGEFGAMQKMFCSTKKLAELLGNPKYYVVSANSAFMDQYESEHRAKDIENLEVV